MREKFIITILSPLIMQIFTLIANYYLIFYLDLHLAGVWALLNSIVNIGFLFIDIGLITIHYQYSEKENFDFYFGSFLFLKIVLSILNVIATLILITILGLWDYPFLNIIILLLLSNSILSILNILLYHLKGKLKIFKVEIPFFISTFSLNIFKIYLAFNLSLIQNPLLWISIGLIFLNSIFFIIILIIGKNDFILRKPKKSYILEYLKDVRPLVVVNILSIIAANIGNIILAYSFDNETLAYFYLVNGYILVLISTISLSLVSLWIPLYSKYLANKNYTLVEELIHTTQKYISIVILSIIIIVFVVADKLFLIFLPVYFNSLPILYLLVFYSYFEGINRNYGALLISGKKQKLLAYLMILIKTLRLVLYFLLIPKNVFGLASIGYALAIIIPEILLTILLIPLIKKIFNIKPQKKILNHFPIFLIALLSMIFLKLSIIDKIFQNDIVQIIILSGLSMSLFIALLFLFKILTKKDVIFFKSLLNIKRYIHSIKGEF